MKNQTQIKNKKLKNVLPNLLKQSKRSYFEKYFQRNLINLKIPWKGEKKLIPLKKLPNCRKEFTLLDNYLSLTTPQKRANTFNIYFDNATKDI